MATVFSAAAHAQAPPAAPPAAASPEVAPVPASTPEVAPVPASTPLGSGPYRAIMESDASLPTHTIYRPADLAGVTGKLPIVVWGNGACANAGNRFRWFLSEIASYGFLVIATGPIGPPSVEQGPPLPFAPLPPPDGRQTRAALPPAATHSSQLLDAMSWAIAVNERADSPLFHRLDAAKIGVMGQSCGGVQAIEVSGDPRVTTTVVLNSGLLPEPTGMAGGKMMTKADLTVLHAPTAYISGDAQDIAFLNANDDYTRLDAIPVLRAYERGVTHSGTYREPNGGEFAGVVLAWLQWQLQHDNRAAALFTGGDCGLCVNPRWVVQEKKLP
jgi:dienelactone hydrolase